MPASSSADQLRALAIANARFWGSVAPLARRELARWREHAATIEEPALREIALEKLQQEAFNAEVAATLATLTPRGHRGASTEAIIALEVLFDYLDGRTEALFAPDAELSADEALREGRRLYGAMRAAVDGQAPSLEGPDSAYLHALWRHAHERAATLPGLGVVAGAALAAASRCAEAQLRLHARSALGEGQLQGWAEEACEETGLGWREYAGGCASSVLSMHALIASAAQPRLTPGQAQQLDSAYLAIGAVITTLDSLVDDTRDTAAGEAGYIGLYMDREEIQQRLGELIALALARTEPLRDGPHHAMTLAGVAAYYTTHPGASDPQNRAIRSAVRRALAPSIWPAVAVLASWRAAKAARAQLSGQRAPAPQARKRRASAGKSVR